MLLERTAASRKTITAMGKKPVGETKACIVSGVIENALVKDWKPLTSAGRFDADFTAGAAVTTFAKVRITTLCKDTVTPKIAGPMKVDIKRIIWETSETKTFRFCETF